MTEEDISDQERQKLLNRLHKSLFWVGEQIPKKITIEGKEVHLHEVVWEIVNKPELKEEDLENIDMLSELLCNKEKEYEDRLEHDDLSCERAKELFDRAAGVRRAIMDLHDLTIGSKRKAAFKERRICQDVNTREWDTLAADIKDKKC